MVDNNMALFDMNKFKVWELVGEVEKQLDIIESASITEVINIVMSRFSNKHLRVSDDKHSIELTGEKLSQEDVSKVEAIWTKK